MIDTTRERVPAQHDTTSRTRAAFELGRLQAERGYTPIEPATWNRAEIDAYRAGRRAGAELRALGRSRSV